MPRVKNSKNRDLTAREGTSWHTLPLPCTSSLAYEHRVKSNLIVVPDLALGAKVLTQEPLHLTYMLAILTTTPDLLPVVGATVLLSSYSQHNNLLINFLLCDWNRGRGRKCSIDIFTPRTPEVSRKQYLQPRRQYIRYIKGIPLIHCEHSWIKRRLLLLLNWVCLHQTNSRR